MGAVRAFDTVGEAVGRWLDRQIVSDNIFRVCGSLLTAAVLVLLLIFVIGGVGLAIGVVLLRIGLGAWRFLTP